MAAALQVPEMEVPTHGGFLHQRPDDKQEPSILVKPAGPQGPLLGMQPNATTPLMGQHTRPPLPSATYLSAANFGHQSLVNL